MSDYMPKCATCEHFESCIMQKHNTEMALTLWDISREKEKEKTVNKPIRIDGFTEKCPKCGEKVMYAVGTGTIFHGASESYEDWRVIKHDYCPRCGTKIERDGKEQ